MADAAAYAACVLVLAGCCAYAASALAGRERAAARIRGAVLRARWAWRCHGHPPLPDHETIPEPERS